MSLADLQRSFCDALRSPNAPPDTLLDELLDDGLALQRFNVYRNNFIVLNGDALSEMYPVIKRLVGDSAFRLLASAYVRKYPPMERALLVYGKDFPEFLASIPELSTLHYLKDVARLEYAWTVAYHAEDVERLEEHQITALPAEHFELLHLRPHPSMYLLHSEYPVYRIWEVNQSEDSEEVISLDDGPTHLVIIRPGARVETRVVSIGAFTLLQKLGSGETIGDAYIAATRIDPVFNLERFFAQHLFDGTFCSLTEN
ncbi:MAG: DNA-binding domain-containing protein [Candidatus Thiodiazotropha sp. (ex Codakia rugifera)]|nr:DNA-binding domain-containing protein [Candidatus Thiodiazotropha sp. (ex Codakia rugifera)]